MKSGRKRFDTGTPLLAKGRGESLLDRVKEPAKMPLAPIDLLTADAATLDAFGIPPRPDPQRQGEAFRIWKEFFVGGATFVKAGIKLAKAEFQLNAGASMALSQSRFATSANWSGATIVPTRGNMIVVVAGRWTVPTPTLPPQQERAPGPNALYSCSTWIGLDGQRLYLNSSLPQIGTTQTLTVSATAPPVAAAFAWFQWWDRPAGGSYIALSNFPVVPGDEIACLIWVTGASSVTAVMVNLSTEQITLVVATAPTVTPPGGTARQLVISGATAEWIMERPTKFGSTEMFPFPNYGNAEFLDCAAVAGPRPAQPQSVEDLQAARLIRMFDTLDNPRRTQFVSMSEKRDDTSARVHYGDF